MTAVTAKEAGVESVVVTTPSNDGDVAGPPGCGADKVEITGWRPLLRHYRIGFWRGRDSTG